MFNLFGKSNANKTVDNHQFLGVVDDPRSEVEKGKDWQTAEFVKLASVSPDAPVVTWVKKDPSAWRSFTVRNQNGSGSCVAQTTAKLLEVENSIEETTKPLIPFSAYDVYDRRANKPGAGMYGPDALTIASKFGACSEDMLPSQLMTEAQMNAQVDRTPDMVSFADKYRAGGYGQLPFNIDAVASFIQQTGKAVMFFTYFLYDEWTDVPEVKHPTLQQSADTTLRHAISAVDFTLWGPDNKKAIIIEDSWGSFNAWKGKRVITEDWFNNRVYFCGNLLSLPNDHATPQPQPQPIVKPKFHFTRQLGYGMTGKDVRNLQDMLKFEGFFPKAQLSTGAFYTITAKAVLAWQLAHGFKDFLNEPDIRKIKFGPKSIALANNLYA